MTHLDEPESPFITRRFRTAALFLSTCGLVAVLVVLFGSPAADPASAGPPRTTSTLFPSSVGAGVASTQSPTASAMPDTPDSSLIATDPLFASSAASDPAAASVCGLPQGDQTIPVAPPTAVWQFVGNRIAAPFSEVYGPGQVSAEGIGNCFARSPTGALFAMMQSVAWTAAPSDRVSQAAVVSQRGSRTNLYEQAISAAEFEDAAAATGFPADNTTLVKQTLLGYTFIDYTPGRATIAVAVGIGDPSRGQSYQPSLFTGVVLWESGDWKFVYSAQTAGSMAPILSSGQYTAWTA